MARLNLVQQKTLQPERLKYALEQLEGVGVEIQVVTETEIDFLFRGSVVRFFPYSGWATGATIKDGRGIKNLLTQLKTKP